MLNSSPNQWKCGKKSLEGRTLLSVPPKNCAERSDELFGKNKLINVSGLQFLVIQLQYQDVWQTKARFYNFTEHLPGICTASQFCSSLMYLRARSQFAIQINETYNPEKNYPRLNPLTSIGLKGCNLALDCILLNKCTTQSVEIENTQGRLICNIKDIRSWPRDFIPS